MWGGGGERKCVLVAGIHDTSCKGEGLVEFNADYLQFQPTEINAIDSLILNRVTPGNQ